MIKKPNESVLLDELVLLSYGSIGTKLGLVKRLSKKQNEFKVILLGSPNVRSKVLPVLSKLRSRTTSDVLYNFGQIPYCVLTEKSIAFINKDLRNVINVKKQINQEVK